MVASFAVPVVALARRRDPRWRHRTYFVLARRRRHGRRRRRVAVRRPERVRRAVQGVRQRHLGRPRAAQHTARGARSSCSASQGCSPRASARSRPDGRLVAGRRGGRGVLVFVALVPVLAPRLPVAAPRRPEDVPEYWKEAAAAMQARRRHDAVLEIPGADFAAYRWGNTIEPVTPGLIDRPYVAREMLPSGTPPSVNLLVALDHRIQEGTLEPAALAAYARGSPTSARSRCAPTSSTSASTRRGPGSSGSCSPSRSRGPRRAAGVRYRHPQPAAATAPRPRHDRACARRGGAEPAAGGALRRDDAVPIVHAAPTEQPVVLDGDGEGIVDAAAAGLLDGDHSCSRPAALAKQRCAGSSRRAPTSCSPTPTGGATSSSSRRARQHRLHRARGQDSSERRVPARSVPGSTATPPHGRRAARWHGRCHRLRHADRPSRAAVDGDPRPRGSSAAPTWSGTVHHPLRPPRPSTTSRSPRPRSPERAVDHRGHVDVRPRRPGHRDARRVVVLARGPDDLVPEPERRARRHHRRGRHAVTEQPQLRRVLGGGVRGHAGRRDRAPAPRPHQAPGPGRRRPPPRRRAAPPAQRPRGRLDEELHLDRRFVLPDVRSFLLSGTARIEPNAADPLIDTALGTTAPGTKYKSSST